MKKNYTFGKETTIKLWNAQYKLDIIANAYDGQEILESQIERLKYFGENQESISATSLNKLKEYYNKKYAEISAYKTDLKKDISEKELINLIKPKAIIFTRYERFGIICDCAWDDEHGIAIMCKGNDIWIGYEDEVL